MQDFKYLESSALEMHYAEGNTFKTFVMSQGYSGEH